MVAVLDKPAAALGAATDLFELRSRIRRETIMTRRLLDAARRRRDASDGVQWLTWHVRCEEYERVLYRLKWLRRGRV